MFYLLQQHLPFTVLKPFSLWSHVGPSTTALQQHLPFTVLKQSFVPIGEDSYCAVATTPTVYGIETSRIFALRPDTKHTVATTPTVYGIETYNVM